jgi:hypothetical protein
MNHKSCGKLTYRDGALIIEVQKEIGEYYLKLLCRSIMHKVNKPMHPPHITLIGHKEIQNPILPKEINSNVDFVYSGEIEFHNNYYYLRVEEQPLFLECRKQNGLEPFYDKIKGYHITIGNVKV